MIYLDHHSTTPLDPRLRQTLVDALAAGHLNPASQHRAGAQARRALEEAREEIVAALGGSTAGLRSDRLLFTSGGTEANNLALLGLAGEPPSRVLVSAIEHPSIAAGADELRRRGHGVEVIPVTSAGVVDLAALRHLLQAPTRLVSVMLANNETGVVQPVGEVAQLCRERGAICHTDAVQAIGKRGVPFGDLGVDALTIAPHKFHGPLGIGGLLLRSDLAPRPLHFGGFQQGGVRPGTESVPLAIAFAAAVRLAIQEQPARAAHLRALQQSFESRLVNEIDDVVLHGAAAERLPSVTNASFVGLDRQALLLALDLAGVACSTGSACQSGSSEPSPVLRAMGLPREQIESALRFSWGASTTADEMTWAADIICRTVKDLRRRSRG